MRTWSLNRKGCPSALHLLQNTVREEGGVPPLVSLLSSLDAKVQRASAGALRTLAFKNEDNKNQIVECGALPVLIRMLRSADTGLHYEAVGVVGNLVHSSTHIKRQVGGFKRSEGASFAKGQAVREARGADERERKLGTPPYLDGEGGSG
eukprot:364271-Chlamydomonas_euryale.AAC.4